MSGRIKEFRSGYDYRRSTEAISLADTVAVLSHRPTTIQSVHQIHLTLDGEKTPFNARTAPEFQHYFDLFWKELQNDEKRQ